MLGFLQDNWDSIARHDRLRVDLGSTVAQFKILTPYPGTPLWKQMAPRVYEKDWEQFDGFTPTFTPSDLTRDELQFLLGAAYTRFYMRPSYLANYLRIAAPRGAAALVRSGCDAPGARARARRARSAPLMKAAGDMLTAISRYGARVVPEHRADHRGAARARGQLVQGPHIAAFEARSPARSARRTRVAPRTAAWRSTTC